ncbi:MAG: hypothetical protein JST84_20970 [Acidobacteria bacterium]|nr:hypothetical protein [Acidobacteriota bacterium]
MISTLDINQKRLSTPPNFEPNTPEFDVITLQLNDQGELKDKQSLNAILQHIKNAREKNSSGVIVTLFAHGWHHGGDWDDSHFISFRNLLVSLCLREAERYRGPNSRGRRVIGVYLAWDGDPDDSWLAAMPGLTYLTFWDRYKTAKRLGSGTDLYEIVRSLIQATKSPLEESASNARPHVISPLILAGHSMGAILVELAFLSLLKQNDAALLDNRQKGENEVIDLKRNGEAILAPDLVLALNSAADSEIAVEIKEMLEQQRWQKVAEALGGGIRYNPSVLLSITSRKDRDTGRIWRYAKPGRITEGHDSRLFTHTFTKLHATSCDPRGPIDFGQSWHCVRRPEPAVAASPSFYIDLPIGSRIKGEPLKHMRYRLCSIADDNRENLAWIFQIPGELSKNHNDIFNPQMGSLVLALIQISGAVMSLANEWVETFEA